MSMENGIDLDLTFSEDAMKAYAALKSPKDYVIEEVMQVLTQENITENVDRAAVKKMLDEKKLGKRYLVATCEPPVDGKDGWFEFLFDTNVDTKPKVLKDGSVDYSEYGNVPFVEEGQQIAAYHPATPCRDSKNFRQEVLVAKKGKELARLKGKGFYVSEDKKKYFAKTSGRVYYKGERLVVENELEIDGDVSLSTGDINYENDIHIRGNVLSGVVVASGKGSVVVDGSVEACELYAGKDVVIKNGMQGNGKGKIVAGGSVSGKFFEQMEITSGMDVCANAIMNSEVTAKQDILVSGRFGIIVGGHLTAQRCVEATIIGNMSETKTTIDVGSKEDLFALLTKTEHESNALQKELDKIVAGINRIDEALKQEENAKLSGQKVKLIRSKVEKTSQINQITQKKQEIMERISRADAAKVSATKLIYPGTTISINGTITHIKEEIIHPQITATGSVVEIN